MAVHAHPDDESSKGAGTLARYAAEGHEVLVVSCTGGERGDVLNPSLQNDPVIMRELPEVRRREMAEAARILGVQHHWLGFVDSGLPEGDPMPPLPGGCFALEPQDITVEALVREIRRFRPHVLTTYDENGGYPHPDHIMCHVVSVAAFRAAGDPEAYPHAGPAWQPLKLYYDRAFSAGKIRALHQAIEDAGEESPYVDWIARLDERPDGRITTRVHVADYFEQREGALKAHATQVDPQGNFFKVSRETQAKVWPTEDFDLALSYVERPTDRDEDDLFAGLGALGDADALATGGAGDLVIDDVRERETAS
ncbi:mycothiol conjugate amidase Mca [Demetria terragena]|uniref:mycothiol conjugate amidase Mca n=1 Tax=Demetria terragena TaxID=63959 RepID=UPI00036A1DC3|nr:mycothiol conjugate amidase Mca [Demetria terragena]